MHYLSVKQNIKHWWQCMKCYLFKCINTITTCVLIHHLYLQHQTHHIESLFLSQSSNSFLVPKLMAGIKVFGNATSPSTRRVLLALHEKNLDFELVNIDLKDGEHKKEPFLSRNVSISMCCSKDKTNHFDESCPNIECFAFGWYYSLLVKSQPLKMETSNSLVRTFSCTILSSNRNQKLWLSSIGFSKTEVTRYRTEFYIG